MAKLQINAAPTFFADVGIPVAGKGDVPLKLEFKHRTLDELQAWQKTLGVDEIKPADFFMSMVKSWEFDEPLTAEHAATFLQNHIGAIGATKDAYFDNLIRGRSGN